MVSAFVVAILPSAVTVVHKPANDEILIYSNLTAAVRNLPVFRVDEISIYQSPLYPQSLHKLTFYLGKSSCDRLPYKIEDPENITNTSSSLPRNETFYLLKGSEMTFNICGVTNDSSFRSISDHQSDAYLDFSIEEGLEYISKQQRNPDSQFHHAIWLSYANISLSDQDQTKDLDWACSYLTYTVNKDGYYSIITIAPSIIDPRDILLKYNFTYRSKVIDVTDNLAIFCNEFEENHFYEESNPCKIRIQDSEHVLISQHQCIVVKDSGKANSEDISDFGTIVIEYSNWQVGLQAFYGIGISVFVVSAITVMVISGCFCYKAWRKKRTQHNTSTPGTSP